MEAAGHESLRGYTMSDVSSAKGPLVRAFCFFRLSAPSLEYMS